MTTEYYGYTKDGTTCNSCGELVEYDRKRALHRHLKPAPRCLAARDIAEAEGREGARRDAKMRGQRTRWPA